jgi:hypothetical protein
MAMFSFGFEEHGQSKEAMGHAKKSVAGALEFLQ